MAEPHLVIDDDATNPRDELIALLTQVSEDQMYGRIKGAYIPAVADRLLAEGWTNTPPATAEQIVERLFDRGASTFIGWPQSPRLPTPPNEDLQQVIYAVLYNGGAVFDRDSVVPALEHAILEHLKESR